MYIGVEYYPAGIHYLRTGQLETYLLVYGRILEC